MDGQTLADCAEFLGRDEDQVEELHERAELLPALLARIGLVLSKPPGAAAPHNDAATFYAALDAGWGSKPFLAAELLKWAEQGTMPTQRAVLEVARALCATAPGAELTANRLGMQLSELASAPAAAGFRIEKIATPRGIGQWVLRDLRE